MIKNIEQEISVGDIVSFGSYPQSGDDPEPITWQVLSVENGSALMITEDLLDCMPYSEYTDVTWESCTLRKWLNGEFFCKAFTESEKSRIQTVCNQNPDDLFETQGGNPTDDKVFCLSIDEAKKYFVSNDDMDDDDIDGEEYCSGSDNDRKAKPTAYAIKNGCYVGPDEDTGDWWLRSPGVDEYHITRVCYNGRIDEYGCGFFSCIIGVRPVVSVLL